VINRGLFPSTKTYGQKSAPTPEAGSGTQGAERGYSLVARLQQRVFPRLTHHHPRHVANQQIVVPSGVSSLFGGEVECAAQSVDEVQNRDGVATTDRITNLPSASSMTTEIVVRWTSNPMYFTLFVGCSFR
jgi:hypothetical protein